MFTVKLYKVRQVGFDNKPTYTTKLIEATQVEMHCLRSGELSEISVEMPDKSQEAYYIANRDLPRPEGFADEVEFYYLAYVENARGHTTETIRF